MNTTRTAIVVGGGIAGPIAATALRKAGIVADVYEARLQPADGIGGPVVLHQNGLVALDIIDVGGAVRASAAAMPRTVMSVADRPLGERPGTTGLEPRRIIERSTLYRLIREHAEAAGVHFHYGRRLTGVDEKPNSITALFADSSAATADVLIGADGVHSTVRTLVDPNAPHPKYTGMLGFSGYTVGVEVPEPPGTVVTAFGKRGYYAYWVFAEGRIGWFATLPQRRFLTLSQAREIRIEQWLDRLRDTYVDEVPGTQLVENVILESLSINGPMEITPPMPHWHSHRMVLTGDAVHAPSNGTGQGVSLAVESAIELARCLRDLPDPQSAFSAYEALRRERTERIVQRGENVNRAMNSGPGGRFLMKHLAPLLFKTITRNHPAGLEMLHTIDWAAPAGSDETAE